MKLKLLRQTLLLTMILHLKVRKNEKMTKRLYSETTRELLTWLLTLRKQMLDICGFQDCFIFSYFLATFSYLSILRLSPLNYRLNFK